MKTTLQIGYFGKLPARSDFVKGGEQYTLAGLLDEWLAGMMSQLTANPRWKQHYDGLAPLHFAFVGPRSRHAIAGHLAPCSDQSGRRFPFVAMSALEVPQPQAFVPVSPLALAPLWDRLGVLTEAVLFASDPAAPLQALASSTVEADIASERHAEALASFAGATHLGALEALLTNGESRVCVRRVMLGIGLLLQPFEWTGSTRLARSLALPLPDEPSAHAPVAAFWLALIAPFLRHEEIELALFVAELRGSAVLVVGFSGATPGTLLAIVDPEVGADQLIAFDDTGWVDDMIEHDQAVQRLSACLAQGSLSLAAACDLFRDTFA